MKEIDVLEKINLVIEKFYNNDYDLLNYETDDLFIAERCIASRLALYLQEEFKYYNVDCEYNRHGLIIKKINNEPVYPDIIIHKRKQDKSNLVWIEVKKSSSNKEKIDEDRERLRYVTSKIYEYKYQYGFLIIINDKKENVIIEKYVNGISI